MHPMCSAGDRDVQSAVDQYSAACPAGQPDCVLRQAQQIAIGKVHLTQLDEVYAPAHRTCEGGFQSRNGIRRELMPVRDVVIERASSGKRNPPALSGSAQFRATLSAN